MRINYLIGLVILYWLISSCGQAVKHPAKPPSFKWTLEGTLPGQPEGNTSPGIAGPVAGISGDFLLLGGGSNFPDAPPWDGGHKTYYDEIYVFKKTADSVVSVKQDLHLPYKVAYSANCTTEKGIVIAGGENKDGALRSVLLINWDNEHQELKIRHLPDLPHPLTAGMIACSKHQLYFAGGQNKKMVSNHLYRLDLAQPESGWHSLPNLPHPVTHAVLFLQTNETDSCLYLVGGRKRNFHAASTLYSTVYQFDLKKKEWSEKAALPYALSAYTGLPWGDSTLLVFSGDRGETFHETEILMMKIAREKDPGKREELMKEKNELQKNHPGFAGTVFAYNTHSDQWTKIDTIPFPGQVTTTAVKWDGDVVIPCGEIRAGVRTRDIIVGKVQQ